MASDRRVELVMARTLIGLAAVAAVACGTISAAAETTPALVQRAAERYAAEHRGEIGFARHLTFSLHAGPIGRDVRNDIGIVMRDGTLVRVRYYAMTTNGKASDASGLRTEEDHVNAGLANGHGFFKRPIDPHFMADYRFQPAACDGCGPGGEAFAFTSVVRDEQHGDGKLIIDTATGHVTRLSYVLNRAPAHASSADAVETFGQAIPGLWTCLRVEETFHGRLGLLSGSATMNYTMDRFRRFGEMQAALAALSHGDP